MVVSSSERAKVRAAWAVCRRAGGCRGAQGTWEVGDWGVVGLEAGVEMGVQSGSWSVKCTQTMIRLVKIRLASRTPRTQPSTGNFVL